MHNYMYENHGSNRVLVYRLEKEDRVDEMALGMMNQNKIPGVLPVSYTHIDSERSFRYSSLPAGTLKSVMSGTITRKWILTVLENICDVVRRSEEYLLEVSSFVLDKEYIFVDNINGDIELVYLPLLDVDVNFNFSTFFKDIVTSVITDQTDDNTYIIKLLNYLNTAENFSLLDFMRLVKDLKQNGGVLEEKRRSEKKQIPVQRKQNDVLTSEKKPQVQKGNEKVSSPGTDRKTEGVLAKKAEKHPVRDQDFEVPGENSSFEIPGGMVHTPQADYKIRDSKVKSEESGDEKMSLMFLLRNFSGENLEKFRSQKEGKNAVDKKKVKKEDKKTKKTLSKGKNGGILTLISLDPAYPQNIMVTKESFSIGRKKTNDAVLSGKSEVSREHCVIIKEADSYYVIDRRSSFGTKVNGVPCEPNKKSAALEEGSIIDLPGIQFRVEFH